MCRNRTPPQMRLSQFVSGEAAKADRRERLIVGRVLPVESPKTKHVRFVNAPRSRAGPQGMLGLQLNSVRDGLGSDSRGDRMMLLCSTILTQGGKSNRSIEHKGRCTPPSSRPSPLSFATNSDEKDQRHPHRSTFLENKTILNGPFSRKDIRVSSNQSYIQAQRTWLTANRL